MDFRDVLGNRDDHGEIIRQVSMSENEIRLLNKMVQNYINFFQESEGNPSHKEIKLAEDIRDMEYVINPMVHSTDYP